MEPGCRMFEDVISVSDYRCAALQKFKNSTSFTLLNEFIGYIPDDQRGMAINCTVVWLDFQEYLLATLSSYLTGLW